MMSKSRIISFFAAALLSVSPVWAHAVLLESQPAVSSTIAGETVDVRLRFNSRVDGVRSRLTIVLPDRTSRPLSLKAQPTPDSLAASASGLNPGDYVIRWQVLASDGHISRGEIPFKVIQSAAGK
jgi:copper resistance protein C